MRAVSNRGSERREDAGTRSGAVAERGGDPGEEEAPTHHARRVPEGTRQRRGGSAGGEGERWVSIALAGLDILEKMADFAGA